MSSLSLNEIVILAAMGLGCVAYMAVKAMRFFKKPSGKGGKCGSGCGCSG